MTNPRNDDRLGKIVVGANWTPKLKSLKTEWGDFAFTEPGTGSGGGSSVNK